MSPTDSSVIETATHDGVRVITINNPPVNALSAAVVSGLKEAIDAAAADGAVTAMVVTGAGRAFIAGADIREFGKPRPKDAPSFHDVLAFMDRQDKPIVAALNGVALGGGLETALGCNYRVASPKAQVGLPEVSLGIIPGAGGTQRLPRVAGVEAALDMIVSGSPVNAARAKDLGIVDDVVEGDVVAAAIAFARDKAAAGGPHQRISEMDDKVAAARGRPEIFDDFEKSIARRARGFEAPYGCIEAVRNAVELPFEEGLKKEREIFSRLVAGVQSQAQRHAFFAEREVAKIPDVPRDTPTQPIDKAGVIGCGTMGGGIAMNFANGGIPVTVLEVKQEALDTGLDVVRKNYAGSVSRGRMTQEAMDKRMGLITGTTSYDDLADADIVIEAAFEDMDVKKEIFAKLDAVTKPEAILATNTSTLDVNEIAAATERPDKVIGTHFFSPANVMRLLENVRGEKTSKETIATVMKLSKAIGKVGVLVGVCDGFVGNRMLHAYTRQAGFLLEEGALPQQVDKVIYDFGFPMGPFAMGDLAGLDVGYLVRKERLKRYGPSNKRYSPIADRVCEMGRHGQKTGAGWYRYEAGSRTPVPDPEIDALVVAVSKEQGIERRDIGDQEILERCMYPLVNEAAKILDEGIALRPLDIDIVWLYGYGFPRYRGGPMFWADTVGLGEIYEAMSRFHRDFDTDWLEPAPLLERLAKEGKGFKDFVRG